MPRKRTRKRGGMFNFFTPNRYRTTAPTAGYFGAPAAGSFGAPAAGSFGAPAESARDRALAEAYRHRAPGVGPAPAESARDRALAEAYRHRAPGVGPAFPVPIPPPDMARCGTEDPLTGEDYDPARTVMLSDGHCYGYDFIVQLYNNSIRDGSSFISPFNRQPFSPQDVAIVRTLKQGARQNAGRRKSRKKK